MTKIKNVISLLREKKKGKPVCENFEEMAEQVIDCIEILELVKSDTANHLKKLLQ